MKKCGKCVTCPFVKEGKKAKSTATNFCKELTEAVDCTADNIVYLIECAKSNCREQYVGCSEQQFKSRMGQHRTYVNSKNLEKSTGFHFNQTNHKVSDMKVSIIEKVHRKFNTKYRGINRNC